jgi:hypothetical protein
MKKLEKLKIEESKLLSANELLAVKGGYGWTTVTNDTFVGINGDCYYACDSYGNDECQGDSYMDTSMHCPN